MTSASSLAPYEMDLTVQPSDIDRLGHVNNVVYLNWVQNAAVAHWYATATEHQKEAYLWVIARHEIDYKRPSKEGDVLVVKTWVGKASHRLFTRYTEIARKADGKVVAKAKSLWSPVDPKSMRPVRPSKDVYEMFSADE